jgi:hypothetical protein
MRAAHPQSSAAPAGLTSGSLPLPAAGRGDGESLECHKDPSRVLRGSYEVGDFWRGFVPVLEAEQVVAGSPLSHT